ALLGVDPDDAGGPVAPPAASVEREWTVAALEADERPEAYVFLAGESAMVRALRRLSVGPGGVPKKHVSFMGYWRQGQAES
ncbi:SIP domain-containing protein, partial [Micrococcus luteus]